MNLDWGSQTVAQLEAELGRPPADVVSFVAFPLTDGDAANLDAAADQAASAGAVLVVTLEPWGGLAAVTDAVAANLATRLARYGAARVPTIVRFAHEMNGSWYPWGQDPAAYVAAFRRVADAVHAGSPTSAMLWAPNQGDGYPYAGGRYGAAPGGPAATTLDTDGDGILDATDDPYAPYWPGPGYVDWVGMSLYFWGLAYPWGENELPPDGAFVGLMTGSASVPDFYTGYAERFSKPLAIVETAAFYRPGAGGAGESEIKRAWLGQVFGTQASVRFPWLRMVNWFEWRKTEAEVDAVVDWRIAADPTLRTAFLAALGGWVHPGPGGPARRGRRRLRRLTPAGSIELEQSPLGDAPGSPLPRRASPDPRGLRLAGLDRQPHGHQLVSGPVHHPVRSPEAVRPCPDPVPGGRIEAAQPKPVSHGQRVGRDPVVGDDRVAPVTIDHHPGRLVAVALERAPEPHEPSVLEELAALDVPGDLRSDRIVLGRARRGWIQLVPEHAEHRDRGAGRDRDDPARLMVGHGGHVGRHRRHRVHERRAPLDPEPLDRIRVVAGPGLRGVGQHAGVEAPTAAGARLEQDVREPLDQPPVQLVHAEDVAVEQLALAVRGQ